MTGLVYWSIVFTLKLAVLLVEGDHLGVLPVGGELVLHEGQGDDVVQRLKDIFCC